MEIRLTEEQANQILRYLGSKPYAGVFELVNMIQQTWVSQNPEIIQNSVKEEEIV